MRRTRALLLGAALSLTSLAVAPSALADGNGTLSVRNSPAGATDAIQTFRNQATGRCMDDTTNGGFRTWSCNGSGPQKWNVHVWNDGTRQLRNINTGRCIEDTDNGLRTVICNSSPEQSWWIKVWNDGTVRFQGQVTGRCLEDSDGSGFRTWACDSSPNQSWS
ncbi:RICIN domain-containing protein [Streptomyces sp. NPDC049577]|uniref:RICIN domain-containing protein n=1 Tax=Streptomyces sp. NPDC049577 TaxID=3155153 RepID=UPI0034379C0F